MIRMSVVAEGPTQSLLPQAKVLKDLNFSDARQPQVDIEEGVCAKIKKDFSQIEESEQIH